MNQSATCCSETLLRHDKCSWSFGALEFPGEKIIHHQRGDKCGDAKILLRIVIEHVEAELIAAAGQPGEKLVHPELFLVRPLADRVQ